MTKLRHSENASFGYETKLLSVAAENNHIGMVEYLMRERRFVRPDSVGCTPPFLLAIQEGHIEVLKVIQDREYIGQQDHESRNVFHYAFASKKPVEVTKYLEEVLLEESSVKLEQLLLATDYYQDTPFHILARQDYEFEVFKRLFEQLNVTVGHIKGKNSSKETPLHVAAAGDKKNFVKAVLDLGENAPLLEAKELLVAKDKDSNTPLHRASDEKRQGCPPLLQFFKRTKDPAKYLLMENDFGATPFSRAVAAGDIVSVSEMVKDLTQEDMNKLVGQQDKRNASPLHLAAEKGHVAIFNFLVEKGAEITKSGPDEKSVLELAIEKGQREVIRSIIKCPQWKEAFRMPCTSMNEELNTPLRMLIKEIPDLAEEFLDRCCEREVKQENGIEEKQRQDTITMNYDFIEDSKSYKFTKTKDESGKKLFLHVEDWDNKKTEFEDHDVDIDNHPLILMAQEKKTQLLQHPVCSVITQRKWSTFGRRAYHQLIAVYVIYLAALNLFILSSPSPIDSPEGFKCTEFFSLEGYNHFRIRMANNTESAESNKTESSDTDGWKSGNHFFRYVVLFLNLARIVLFFMYGEFHPIKRQMKKSFEEMRNFRKPKLPLVFFFDFFIYSLGLFVACHNLLWNSSCFHWQVRVSVIINIPSILCSSQYHFHYRQVGAITITLSWINLLIQMRLLYGIGIYIIIFKDVILTFLKISIIFVILLVGFAFSFHILLSHRQEFQYPYDAILKTIIMMSGDDF